MKQRFILPFLLTLFFGTGLRAQITILSSDMPSVGDTLRTSIAANADEFDFISTGYDTIWDFTNLRPISQTLDTFRSVTQTPSVFWLSFLTSANIVQRLGSGEIVPGVSLDDAYQFFHKSNSAYKDVGYGLIVSGTPIPLKFSNPDIVYTFPIAIGSTYSSNANLEFNLPNIAFLSIERNRQSEADGWGTVHTPFGSFQALRLKSVVYERDSIYVDSLGQGGTVERNYIEYKWLAKNGKIPVLICVDDELLGMRVIYQDSLRDLTVGCPEYRFAKEMRLIPNPVTHLAAIDGLDEISGSVALSLFDFRGTLVDRWEIVVAPFSGSRLQLPWNFSSFTPGIYLLEIQSTQGRNTLKLMIR